jgi:hypothetical protein
MGKRSGFPGTNEDVAKLTLAQLNAEIHRSTVGFNTSGGEGRKAFFKRLVWLEREREKLHGVLAPRRSWRTGNMALMWQRGGRVRVVAFGSPATFYPEAAPITPRSLSPNGAALTMFHSDPNSL